MPKIVCYKDACRPYSLEFEKKKRVDLLKRSYWRVTKATFIRYRITFFANTKSYSV